MNEGILVIEPGMHTTFQDSGRYGYQKFGIPVSGALDIESLRIANLLVENKPYCAGLEVLYQGPTLEVTAERICLVVAGFGASLKILTTPKKVVNAWQTVVLERSTRFQVIVGSQTAMCYLAVTGGFKLTKMLGSYSTYTRSALGGFSGRALRAGDRLPLKQSTVSEIKLRRLGTLPEQNTTHRIRCTWGIQKNYFTEKSLKIFISNPFFILPESDRMGYRLSGPTLKHTGVYDIVSDGVPSGAIQVPGDGRPIVLLVDRQTTGGYPKIANVISADLAAFSRRRPGQEVEFEIVSIEEAEHIRRTRENSIKKLERQIETVSSFSFADSKALYSENLISGAVRGG